MRNKILNHLMAGTSVALVALMTVTPAQAQPQLARAVPAPDAVLPTPPEQVILTFDQALRDAGTSIWVTNEAGERVEHGDASISPTNRRRASVTLPPLPEGRYTVHYTAASLGGSTLSVGSYLFTVDLPDPALILHSPVNGQSFEPGPIRLDMQVSFFDFAHNNNRIRLYIDGELVDELRTLSHEIEGLEPGVYELKLVLAQFDDQELPDTAITVYVAVAQPDAEMQGRQAAAVAPPDPGLQLTPWQRVALIGLTLILLAVGIMLGRMARVPTTDR